MSLRSSRPLGVITGVVALVLLLTAQERTLGVISDEQQVLGTATAIVETRGLGLPRGFAFAVDRPGGDSLSPYGLGMPLALTPVVALCERVEGRFGGGSSQSLLVLVPLALVTLASLLAGMVARGTGCDAWGQVLAAAGTGLASPLWPLASTLFGETLLAVLLGAAAACAVRAGSASPRAALFAVAAGAAAGSAVLTKSLFLAVAPLALVPLLASPRRVRLVLAAGAGSLVPLLAWLALDVIRFGRPLASYEGQPFSHPLFDGLWRLTVGPNEGLLLYFPFALLAVPGLAWAWRRSPALALGLAAPGVALLLIVSRWWAWDGSAGWGPRLIEPAIPLLAAAAACAVRTRATRVAGVALVGAGIAVNSLGMLQPDAATLLWVDSCGPVAVADEDLDLWPAGLARRETGARRVSMSMVAPMRAELSPVRLHAFLVRLRARPLTAEQRLRLLSDEAPWIPVAPAPRPRGVQGQISGVLLDALVDDLAWPHWGAAAAADPVTRRTRFAVAWQDALEDQVSRALDVGDARQAVRLASKLFAAARHDRSAALLAESLRASGDDERLRALLGGLPDRTLGTPEMQAVLALAARDRGDEATARAHLGQVASALPHGRATRSLGEPISRWPATARPWLSEAAPWR